MTIALKSIKKAYSTQIKAIKDKLELKGEAAVSAQEKKALNAELKTIDEKIAIEVRARIKKEFNYQIPIAEVEKAGISTTGAQIENELTPLVAEFNAYKESNGLWCNKFKRVGYEILEDDMIYRMPFTDDPSVVIEPEIFYNK